MMKQDRLPAARTLVLVSFAASIACAGASGAVTVEPQAARDAPWVFVPRVPAGRLVGPIQDGDGWVAGAGRLRLRVDASGHIEEAADVFASELLAVSHLGGAWVFTTRRGEVFRASEPLGELTPVGDMGAHRPLALVSSEHRIAVLDEESMLFVIDASSVTRVGSSAPVNDASFASATFGTRIVLGGEVLRTNDGGASWTHVDGPWEQAPRTTFHEGDTAYLAGGYGESFAVSPEGAVTRAEATSDEREEWSSDVQHAVEEYLRPPHGLATAMTESLRALTRVDGTQVRLLGGGPSLALPDGCRNIVVSGERFVARCEGGALVSDGSVPFAPLVLPDDAILDPNGQRFVTPGACQGTAAPNTPTVDEDDADEDDDDDEAYDDEEERAPRGVSSFCVHGTTPREIVLQDYCAGRVLGIGNGRLAIAADCPDHPRLLVIALATGEITETSLPDHVAPANGSVAADGTLVVELTATDPIYESEEEEARHADRGTWYAGPLGGSLRALDELASGTTVVVAMDARHLVATEPDPDDREDTRLRFSEDGGASFHVVPRAALGAYAARIDTTGSGTGDMPDLWGIEAGRCGPASADLGDWIWMRPGAEGVVVAEVDAIDVPEVRIHEAHPAQVAIEVDRPRFFGGHPVLRVPTPASTEEVAVAGGWARIDGGHVQESIEGAFSLAVGGEDERGPFAWTAHATAPPTPAPVPASPPRRPMVYPLGFTRALAAFERCIESDRSETCDVLVVRPSGAVSIVPERDFRVVGAQNVAGVLVGADGSLAIRFSTYRHDSSEGAERLDSILTLASDGGASMRVMPTGQVSAVRSLARDEHGRVGLLVERGSEARFVGVDGQVDDVRPGVGAAVTRTCTGAPGEHALDVVNAMSIRVGDDVSSDVVISLGRDGGACVRALSARSDYHGGPIDLRGALVGRAAGGALACAILGADGTRLALPCRVTAPEARSAERERPSAPMRAPILGHLSSGALVAAVPRPGGELILLRLGSGGWTSGTTLEILGEGGPAVVRLVEGSDREEVAAQDARFRVVSASGTEELARDAHLVRGPASEREILTAADDGGGAVLELRRIAGAPLTLRAPARVRRVEISTTSPDLALIALSDGDDDDPSMPLDRYTYRAMSLAGARLALSAPVTTRAIDRAPWAAPIVIGGASTQPVSLSYEETPTSRAGSLIARRLEAQRATPIGPPLTTTFRGASPVPLAVLGAPLRIVYGDLALLGVEGISDVRVVELRGREWFDVAPTWRADGLAVAAASDGDDLVVLGVDAHGALRSVRLHAGAWAELTVPELPESAATDD